MLLVAACLAAEESAENPGTRAARADRTLAAASGGDLPSGDDGVIAIGEGDASDTAADPVKVQPGDTASREEDLAYIRSRRLLIPVDGVMAAALIPSFHDARGGGARTHGAIDIPAPRGTPVLSVDDGHVEKLHTSDGGGLTIYAFDPTHRIVYYYAHLDRYRPGLEEGVRIARGDTIGYVGSTGNAPPTFPHLHFAIARLGPERRWWKGTPVDPYPILTGRELP